MRFALRLVLLALSSWSGCACAQAPPPPHGRLPLPPSSELTACATALGAEIARQPGGVQAGCVRIVLEISLSDQVVVNGVSIDLDERNIMQTPEEAAAARPQIRHVTAGRMPAGAHRVAMVVRLNGDDTPQMGYTPAQIQLRSYYDFDVAPGSSRTVRIIVYETRAANPKARAAVRYVETLAQELEQQPPR
jgi:hypothetical protein